MIGLEIYFDLGRYHANPWTANVNDGQVEWPPSPWRVLRALYSAAHSNVALAVDHEAFTRGLRSLIDAPSPIFQLPPVTAGHTRHYIPKTDYSPLKPGATTKLLDAFLAVDPATPMWIWWEATPDAEAIDALRLAVRGIGYLGRSESVCSVALHTEREPSAEGVTVAPADEGAAEDHELIDLLCVDPGESVERVKVSITQLRRDKQHRPPGTSLVAYPVPPPFVQAGSRRAGRSAGATPTVATYRVRGTDRPALTDAVAIGQTVRKALQSRFGQATGGRASPTFSGREGDRPRASQHLHAHFMALPDRHGRRVDRLVVWAPEGFGAEEIHALATLTWLPRRDSKQGLRCALATLGRDTDLVLPELLDSAGTWQSLTPFGLVRHPKRRNGTIVDGAEEQIVRELGYRGFPEPAAVTLIKGSWHRFRSSKAGTSRLERASLVGARVEFSEPVRGPIAVGALSHYGLGVFTPAEN